MTRSITQALAVVCLAVGSGAAAQQEPQRTSLLFLKGRAAQRPRTLNVAGGVATTLVFDKAEVHSAELAGEAGKRFRALEAGKHAVVIIPKHDLAHGEHISLVVTLEDGTEIPFDLVSPPPIRGPDGQVDVSLDQENIEAVQRDLQLARAEIETLRDVNRKYEGESYSPEHALATLLAQWKTDHTPFVVAGHKVMNEAGVHLTVITFRPRKQKIDVGKTAVVFEVTNRNPKELWKLDEVRLTSATTGGMKTFAVRASASVLGAGQTGRVAVVFDSDQFGIGRKADHLVLELWRAGHVRQASVELAEAAGDAIPCPRHGRPLTREMKPGQLAAAVVSFSLLSGCAGPGMVGLRPDGSPGPEPCPKKALDAMRHMRLHPGDSASIDVDMNKQDQDNITVNDGHIESGLRVELGPVLDAGTLLYGRAWTSGPDVVIRYYQAQPLDPGPPIDICAVARLSEGQMRKKPCPAPGCAVLEFSIAAVVIVDSFR